MFGLAQKNVVRKFSIMVVRAFPRELSFQAKIMLFSEDGIIIKVVKRKRKCFRESWL